MSIQIKTASDGNSGAVAFNNVDKIVVGANTAITIQATANLPTYGAELVTVTSNTITLPGSAFTQNINVVAGTRYRIKWTQTHSVADNGELTISLGYILGGAHIYRTIAAATNMEVVLTAAITGSVALTLTPASGGTTGYSGTGTISVTGLSCKPVSSVIPASYVEKDSLGNISVEHRVTYGGYYNPSIANGVGALSINQQDGIGGANMTGTVTTTSGINNTANGVNALLSNTTGYNNTTNGVNALLSNTTGFQNTANGVQALQSNTTGYYNTANGVNALQSNTTGYYNTANGVQALQSNTTGYHNTANGENALQSNTTGFQNTANGFQALLYNTTGYHNTANGVSSLQYNTTGYQNTANGFQALLYNTTGYNNTTNGVSSLQYNDNGYLNTANGVSALQYNTTGSLNTANGVSALQTNTIFSNCSGLGNNSQVTASNQIQLGDLNTTTYAYGAVQNRSDIRDKTAIVDTTLDLDFITALRPVDFKWDMREDYRTEAPTAFDMVKPTAPTSLGMDATEQEQAKYDADMLVYISLEEAYQLAYTECKVVQDAWLESVKLGNITHDGTHIRSRSHHGLIAQEVKAVMLAQGIDFGGYQDHSISGGDDVLSIGYEELIAPMIKAIQQLAARIAVLEAT